MRDFEQARLQRAAFRGRLAGLRQLGFYRRGNLQAAGSRHNRRKGNTREEKRRGENKEEKSEWKKSEGEKSEGEKSGDSESEMMKF